MKNQAGTRVNQPLLSRRKFLLNSGRALLGVSTGAMFMPRWTHAVSPNEKIVVAHVGVGGMGNGHVSWFAGCPNVETAAICDVDETRRLSTIEKLKKQRPDTKAVPIADFRQILDRKDIDAISCATPDHWHALVSIMAMQAGKDVYSEKPLSHSFAEGRAMVNASERYGRVFQLGTQIHAGENYHRVVELVRAGVIGKIHTARIWKTGGSAMLAHTPPQEPPSTLDWNMWLGPAPWHPYVPQRCHFTFRYFQDYSYGTYADFWCHIADLAFWALEPKGLRKISARGEIMKEGMSDTPKWIDVDFEFDNLKLYWTTTPPDVPGAKERGIGAYFEGTKGSLVADYGSRVIFIDGKELTDIPEVQQTIRRSPSHPQNFLSCVKSRALTESHAAYAFNMATPMYLGAISLRLGRALSWDPIREQFIGDDHANRLLFRPYRAPWFLPT
jgi:predicted dehydrogenase